jgi:hypothetical protein
MLMKESDPLDALLREWKLPEPDEALDQRVIAAYRSARRAQPAASAGFLKRFWATRVSIPAPALVAAALALFALVLWLRVSNSQSPPLQAPGVVTRLNVTGFQPLPNGEARVLPLTEGQP